MRILTAVFGMALVLVAGAWFSIQPSHEREWSVEQARLPRVEVVGERVEVRDVRDFRYAADGTPTEVYADRVYDLDLLESVWFILTPFSTDWRGPAHAFVSFGFADSQFVAISVEARRERDEEYSVLKGLLKRFEILYVIGDERDLIGLRTGRGDDVYLYPMRATREQARALFLAMVRRADELRERPEFYGSFRNNCTTNILRHVNSIAARPIRYGPRILLPGYSDAVAHERGMIDTELTLEQARARYRITDVAGRYASAPDFSQRIRSSE